jgi:heme-degrading monooxygenase HmoA
MFARIARIKAPADRLDEGVRRLQESVPTIKALAGFRKAYQLVDREGGELTTVTLWDTAEALQAAGPTARQILLAMAEATGGTLADVRMYEVAASI